MSENYNNNWHNDDFQTNSTDYTEEAYINRESLVEKKKTGKPKRVAYKLAALVLCSAVLGSALTGGAIAAFLPGYIEGKVSQTSVTNKINGSSGATTVAKDSSEDKNKEEGVLTIPEIAIKVGPATVGIVSSVPTTTYFGTVQSESSGSGIIISEDGYVVTNQHVINGASEITVHLSTGEKKKAEIIGQDVKTDLAVLKMEKAQYPYAEFGVSSDLEVGDLAVAIGNPLGMEFAGSVTSGIISALNRTVEVDGKTYNLLQTDAAINSGNSGGALVNCYGEVIGINSVKISSAGVEGLGFAIPVDEAKPVIQDLINFGYVKGRPVLGIIGSNIGEDVSRVYNYPEGVFVEQVVEGSGAAAAGIKRGDIITHIDDTRIKTTEELNKVRDKKKAGDSVKLTIERSGRIISVNAVLGEEKAQ